MAKLGPKTQELLPVDRNVDLPAPGQGRRKYPFRSLQPVHGNPPCGDSFLVECGEDEMESVMNRLTRSAHWVTYKTGRRFALRRMKDGVRCWRLS